MKRRILSAALAAVMLLGLAGCAGRTKEKQKYQTTFLDLFDTVTTVTGYAESEEAFQEIAETIHREMEALDHLYDIYREYPGTVNLCTVNAHPGETLEVDRRIIDLLVFARDADAFSNHRTDAMLGAMLSLWHEAREAGIENPENAALPETEALRDAMKHTGFQYLEIDPEQCTVRLTDPEARLDVGALAKGYAVQRAAEKLPAGILISAGGNVAATGPKLDGSAWIIGIQDPDSDGYLHKVGLTAGAVVTSGDYQRYYTVDGRAYHHIIDPGTLYPGDRWRSVTVVCGDSGLGDALSTSLFLLDREEGQALLERFGAEALWIAGDGTEFFSPGFPALLRD